jgi:catechol 2,3-dioxygenase
MNDTATGKFDLRAAPLRIDTVTLAVRDIEKVAVFYREVIGLGLIARDENRIVLGAGAQALVVLEGDPALAPDDPREAGLFHTAFLLPDRADLGRWLTHAGEAGIGLQGAADHLVSEAVYLADPEGNGIEIYVDRPARDWQTPSGEVRMANLSLDLEALRDAAAGTVWSGFPTGGVIGHVHLQVGDTAQADRFYAGCVGFDIATRYPGASFYGSGGYHHQLAGNIWNSRGAGRRPGHSTGLARLDIVVRDPAHLARIAEEASHDGNLVAREAGAVTIADPWGTHLRLAGAADG